MWPNRRAEELNQRCHAAYAKPTTWFTFIPSAECNFIGYFPVDYAADCQAGLSPNLRYLPPTSNFCDADIAIVTAHGSDLSPALWEFRKKLQSGALVLVWMWDNHLADTNNIRTALAGDFVFVSHNYCAGYLFTPAAALGAHIPLCSAQWTTAEAKDAFAQFGGITRSSRLLVNYVDYPFSWRSELLGKLGAQMPEANVLLMAPGERSRYFGKTRAERFKEWCEHKSTLILPVSQDFSTRIFDALLAGQVLLVPNIVADFDQVIPPALQSELGIIKLPDVEVSTIREGAKRAERRFDELGMEGVRARHQFVLEKHMTVHRIGAMLEVLKGVATKKLSVVFGGNSNVPFGLHVVPTKV